MSRALAPSVALLREQGIEVCLRMCVLSRPTREEAIKVAESLLPERDIPKAERSIAAKDDSQMYREAMTGPAERENWVSNSLWTGLVPYYGPVWTTLLGTPVEIAAALLESKPKACSSAARKLLVASNPIDTRQ